MTARLSLDINLAALATNYRWLAGLAAPAICAAAVKANAYGIGLAVAVRTLTDAGCAHFFVATIIEAEVLRALDNRSVIYCLDGVQNGDDVEICRIHGIIPVLNCKSQIDHWRHWNGPCAVMVDTGMNRLGLNLADVDLAQLTQLNCVLLMSHLASADDPASDLTAQQQMRFAALSIGAFQTPKSLANSAGVLLGKDFHFDMVRPGIALYGGYSGAHPVVTARARVLQVRTVQPGESVGYNETWRADGCRLIATLGIGYADGYGRAFSNCGQVWIDGHSCPVVGRISMDLTTVDVTDAGTVRVGDTVEIFGAHSTLAMASAASGLSQYELLTGLGPRYVRQYSGSMT